MRRTIKAFSILITIIALNQGMAFGGGSSSSGGDGIKIHGKVYLLDLAEMNIHQSPFFANRDNYSQEVVDSLVQQIGISQEEAKLLSSKLLEIYSKNAFFELAIKRAIVMYEWVFTPQHLIDVKDEDLVLKFPIGTLVQLAVRAGARIYINLDTWKNMNIENRVALILHEAIYAISAAMDTMGNGSSPQWTGSSPQSRVVCSSVFSEKFKDMTKTRFNTLLARNGFSQTPSLDSNKFFHDNEIIVPRPEYFGIDNGPIAIHDIYLDNPTQQIRLLSISEYSATQWELFYRSYEAVYVIGSSSPEEFIAACRNNTHPDYVVYTPQYAF